MNARLRIQGFTLVEVTLSTVVIGLGLLALFGLGRLAIQNAREAESDTRAAMLADDVFASLHAYSEQLCASNDPSAWAAFWTNFANGVIPLPIAQSSSTSLIWANGSNCMYYLYGRPDLRHAAVNPVPEWGARFTVSVDPTNSFATMGVVGSAAGPLPNEVKITLHITPDVFSQNGESLTFYTHFAEHGTLP